MADSAELRERLQTAEKALDDLIIGGQVVEIEYEGHRQKFSLADETRLRRHIRSLKKQLGESVPAGSREAFF